MGQFRDITGKRFGKLKAMRFVGQNRWNQALWLCVCNCGNKRTVRGTDLVERKARHCVACNIRLKGKRASNYVHGGTTIHKREHNSWFSARQRCNNPKCHAYEDYGGRGIRVCQRWNAADAGFVNFLQDMGRRPANKSLDRIDVNGNYSCGHCPQCIEHGWPANCRWATQKVQNMNQRRKYPPPTVEEFKAMEAEIAAEEAEMNPY